MTNSNTSKDFIGTTAFGYFKKLAVLPSGTEVAEISLMAGEDKDGKTRYLNGSFIVSDKSEGLRGAERQLKEAQASKADAAVLVVVQVKDLHGEPSKGKKLDTLYVNYRGLLQSIRIHTKKS